jgi:MFS family permease
MNDKTKKDLRFNYLMNVFDGSFFGFAMGFASFTTVIPLFLSTFTGSAILIGLIPAIRSMGYQLPPLFMARAVARQTHYKPMILFNTIHERIPFLGLALIAWFSPVLGNQWSVILAFLCIIWQGLGGGFTANPLQNLIARVFPSDIRATVIGTQSSASNLFASGSAILAGILLARLPSPLNYTLCFALASISLAISFFSLSKIREPDKNGDAIILNDVLLRQSISAILRKDRSFRWFILAKMLAQFAMLASAFYMIYAVLEYQMSASTAGLMTSVLFITQVVANPSIGYIADRWSRRGMLEIGGLTLVLAPLIACLANGVGWFYLVFILTGISNAIFNTLGLAFILEYGSDAERPTYFGLANTLTSPVSIVAPLIGGWLADQSGFQTTFLFAAIAGVFTVLVLHIFVTDPRQERARA